MNLLLCREVGLGAGRDGRGALACGDAGSVPGEVVV
eukprot:CAMPEP_0177271152 /NCGR_PEP_ID=MMETSP0367-20130122/65367_1 /TAXON_ID=447022 ORGANISM="Scrippsiella hangoei-like, Strain SHHI-4" /NCGR_SAMPLE_ID=MMETSP0367 /ASSEMBLY_ACC=CAM_ASM_000362 /LENGTH=35 /DNA_ID= /DNA_START= /DNA_END= /DNA_ORIENTATION=